MDIITDYRKDFRTENKKPGAYEWWYFDAISSDRKYSLVIIFYDGIPFSPRYNRALAKGKESPEMNPSAHPAVSISIYKRGEPIFYSLTEYDPASCFYSDAGLDFRIGNNHIFALIDSNELSYKIQLDEELPSGDSLKGTLLFKSQTAPLDLFGKNEQSESNNHLWNLIQPRANVQGELNIHSAKDDSDQEISFHGCGYHDHNLGLEPMKNVFKNWYWGRIHFNRGTLVYYIMQTRDGINENAWFISKDNQTVLSEMKLVKSEKPSFNSFLLSYSQKLTFKSEDYQAIVNQKLDVDSGPFYLRFNAGATITIPNEGTQVATGITEYIYPSRIDNRLYWPLINMRYRYAGEKNQHWVQKNPKLYRWTW